MSRSYRPWTAQDQATAEVAAACGVSFRAIGRMLERSDANVRCRLLPQAAEKARERSRRWQKQNPEKRRESVRRRRERNPEKERERERRWRKRNPEKEREACRRYRERNPEKVREHCRRRSALRRSGHRRALTRLTREAQAQRFTLFGDRCAYCGSAEALTLDHVLALTRGGLDEPGNIAPACGGCNSSKNVAPVEEWYRRQPFFTEPRWRRIVRHCPGAAGQLGLAMPAA